MIITVGNTKGGVGKTTLAVQLAIARALAGRDVWLIDGDRQGTAAAAIAARAEGGRQPGIACAQYADGPALRGQVQQQRNKWQDIIIDAGGRDSTALRAALILSDVLLVPFAPRSYDVWALDDMAALVDEEERTLEEDHEPYMLRSALMEKSPQGRLATRKAYEHLDCLHLWGSPDRPNENRQRTDDDAHTPDSQSYLF